MPWRLLEVVSGLVAIASLLESRITRIATICVLALCGFVLIAKKTGVPLGSGLLGLALLWILIELWLHHNIDAS